MKDEYQWIYTAYITRNGKRIYASQYGLRAFYIRVKKR
jgi:hypothetical protein